MYLCLPVHTDKAHAQQKKSLCMASATEGSSTALAASTACVAGHEPGAGFTVGCALRAGTVMLGCRRV